MEDADQAAYLYSDLNQLCPKKLQFFPSSYRRAIKYGHQDEPNLSLRSTTLATLINTKKKEQDYPLIISYPEAIIEAIINKGELKDKHLYLNKGQIISQEELRDKLLDWGFKRVDYISEVGEFAIRGSIFDIYSYSEEYPIRLDFFDDELESIRFFNLDSQLSIQQLEEISLMNNTARSNQEQRSSLLSLIQEHKDYHIVCKSLSTLLDSFNFVWNDEPNVADKDDFHDITSIRQYLIEPKLLAEQLKQFPCLFLHQTSQKQATKGQVFSFHTKSLPIFTQNYEALSEQIKTWDELGFSMYICSEQKEQYERICNLIKAHHEEVNLPKYIPITLHEGFIDEEVKTIFLTEHQIFGRYHKYNLRSDKLRLAKASLSLKELQNFQIGDLIVHMDYGIGRYRGLINIELLGRKEEVVYLEYKDGASVYVKLPNLNKLSLYRHKDDALAVELASLNSSKWQRLKEKTKNKVKDIARELITLYSERKEAKGFAFSPDCILQNEMEASFIYEETLDQDKAIKAIKEDMEKPYPMDRLLCGDVGFGKTEVAMRASFKAVCNGKQVCILVPTTVLAYQHFQSFTQRFNDYPINIAYLSRAQTPKKTKQILQELENGKIDIIIGTHRITSKDVHFNDLGLLVIDEEQKFGVSVKERIRKLQVNVDTLTMSATPIPRTLQFSLMGARDLSNITTPPNNRYPIETIHARFSETNIAEAINFELSRNGQVYFIHNRIENIELIAEQIKRAVPDARIVIGHGQMPSQKLEQVLLDFSKHDYDVLLATTIIENGIDISNANTIIINNAHHYGLASLHQLRGRVGRSHRKAFCYLFTPPTISLASEARRRLKAIETFSDLGSGIHIALQDLDIRGAGNAFGSEQSGFIMDMGYETYQKIFDEAVKELRNSEIKEEKTSKSQSLSKQIQVETSIDISPMPCLPLDYVPNDSERLFLYRELNKCLNDTDLSLFRSQLIDRFGKLPQKVEQLILVPKLRNLGKELCFEKIILQQNIMHLYLLDQSQTTYYQSKLFDTLLRFITSENRRCKLVDKNKAYRLTIKNVPTIEEAIKLLESFKPLEDS